ncbi:MAG: amidohydrolase [Candidatus Pacebacteria bacterium]|nr:amidohydrolase [Candidatus Paceibacterota bacterium]
MRKETKEMLKRASIIDDHVHLSVHAKSRAKIEELDRSMVENSIDAVIALAAYFPRKTGSITNEQILSLTKNYDNIVVFGSLDAENNLQKGVLELGKLLTEDRIVGIKLYPGYQFVYPNDKKLDEVYELAAKFGVPVMFHSGLAYKSPGGIRFSRPIYFDDVADKFPELKMIISHLGDPDIRQATAVAHKNPNVYLDFSGLVSNTTKNQERSEKWKRKNEEYITETIANVMIDLMGTEKIIFGTDWPISSHKAYLSLVDSLEERLDLDSKEKEQILAGNILKVLGVKK